MADDKKKEWKKKAAEVVKKYLPTLLGWAIKAKL